VVGCFDLPAGAYIWTAAAKRRTNRAVFLDMGDGRYIEVFGQGSTVQSEGRRRRPDVFGGGKQPPAAERPRAPSLQRYTEAPTQG
jgi:hypothetical protein